MEVCGNVVYIRSCAFSSLTQSVLFFIKGVPIPSWSLLQAPEPTPLLTSRPSCFVYEPPAPGKPRLEYFVLALRDSDKSALGTDRQPCQLVGRQGETQAWVCKSHQHFE